MDNNRLKLSIFTRVTKVGQSLSREWQLWIMVLPAIAAIFIFNYLPMYGIQLAFREFDYSKGIYGGQWVGFKYFKQFFNSPMFFKTIRNTFTISATNIILGFPAPIIMALMFNQVRNKRIQKVLRTTSYMPNFISTVVMVSMIGIFLAPKTGLVTKILIELGLISPDTNIMGVPKYFVWIYVLSGIWQGCGWGSIIYMAALSNVDTQLYDAAYIDGASRLRLIWHIDLPSISNTIIVLLILNMGGLLSVGFEKAFLLQNHLNTEVAEVISTYVYKIGIRSSQFSYSTAIGLFNTFVNFFFLIATNQIAKKLGQSSLF